MKETNHILERILEQYHLGEVSDEKRKLIETVLSSDAELRLQYEALKESDQELRKLFPLDSMPALTAVKDAIVPIPMNKVKRDNSFRSWARRNKPLLYAAAVLLCTLIPSLFYLRGRITNNEMVSLSVIPDNTALKDGLVISNRTDSVLEISSVPAPGFGQSASERTIPNDITVIEDNKFSNKQLTSITIPDNITLIGSNAFSNNLLTSVIIPESVVTIGDWAFSYNQLASVTIPNSVVLIGDGAFANNRLTSITIPASVTFIGDKAFEGNQLTSITIGANVSVDGAISGSFTDAYNIYNNAAGTYTRPNASSDVWTKQ